MEYATKPVPAVERHLQGIQRMLVNHAWMIMATNVQYATNQRQEERQEGFAASVLASMIIFTVASVEIMYDE